MGRGRTTGIAVGSGLLGAALAVISIQAWNVNAAPGDLDATYQPLEPCRLMDTRPGDENVGDRIAPLGPGETFTAQVTGTNGNCVAVPGGATGVAMNVTVVNPTAPSFLSLFPADLTELPLVSNLNYANGSPPTPNKVDSKLSPDGKLKIYNTFGTVDVIVDVVGIYTKGSLVDIQNQLDALQGDIADLQETDRSLATDIRDAISSTTRVEGNDTTVASNWKSVVSAGVNLTRRGTVLVFASTTAFESEAGADVLCVITDRTSGFPENENMLFEAAGATVNSPAGEGDAGNLAGTESFRAVAGTTARYHLMCRNREADDDDQLSSIWDPQITLLFIPDR